MQNVKEHDIYAKSVFSLLFDSDGPPLRSSGQSSWLQIRRSRVRFPGTTRKKKKVVGLEWGPLSHVSTTE
jgi:hypothetical protein